jgi:activating signal cointegrator complex subunit 1
LLFHIQLVPLHQGGGVRVAVKDLEYMNDDPSEVGVLYLQVEEMGGAGSGGSGGAGETGAAGTEGADGGGKLARVCKAVVDIYGAAGLLLERDDKPVKLHATLMNTRLRRKPKDAAAGAASSRESFDARPIFDAHKGLDCGEWSLEAVHLSRRGEFDVDLGGYYRCIAQCPLQL